MGRIYNKNPLWEGFITNASIQYSVNVTDVHTKEVLTYGRTHCSRAAGAEKILGIYVLWNAILQCQIRSCNAYRKGFPLALQEGFSKKSYRKVL